SEGNTFAIGPSAEGALLLVGGDDKATTYTWNGAALEKRDGFSPRTTSKLAFDPATGTTWALEFSSDGHQNFEAVWRWQNGAWQQRKRGNALAGTRWSRLYFDTQANALARLTDTGILTWVEEGTEADPDRHWQGRDTHAPPSDSSTYDGARNELV